MTIPTPTCLVGVYFVCIWRRCVLKRFCAQLAAFSSSPAAWLGLLFLSGCGVRFAPCVLRPAADGCGCGAPVSLGGGDLRVGLIGFGAIGQPVASGVDAAGDELVAVLVRRP